MFTFLCKQNNKHQHPPFNVKGGIHVCSTMAIIFKIQEIPNYEYENHEGGSSPLLHEDNVANARSFLNSRLIIIKEMTSKHQHDAYDSLQDAIRKISYAHFAT